ncbi:MAG: segregation/condensation protein A [Betaproteobacteria bacterium]|jgi:segregation and condensation protein A|nr:MAG: segregation/condensation protein A [Betaproteobacteria bacterium]
MVDTCIEAVVDAPVEPLARVLGQPWLDLPQDLYIPPEAMEVLLEAFEGPLDLLWWLIRRNDVDILDIPMADLTRQYIDYIEVVRTRRLDLAAEYLVMAAMLLEIKSRMLLPRPAKEAEVDESLDPRAELVRRLLDYEQIRLGARGLDAWPRVGRDFQPVSVWVERMTMSHLPEVSAEDLRHAWEAILQRARMNRHHRIGRQELSVREHMSRILRYLASQPHTLFTDLFPQAYGRPELIVTFLAMLELARERLLELTQVEAFAPIHVRLPTINAG